jgi:hypothetical protein
MIQSDGAQSTLCETQRICVRNGAAQRHYFTMPKSPLLQSHDELRAILRLAGTELRKRNIGRKDSPLLQLMRRVLREARVVAKAERERMD